MISGPQTGQTPTKMWTPPQSTELPPGLIPKSDDSQTLESGDFAKRLTRSPIEVGHAEGSLFWGEVRGSQSPSRPFLRQVLP